MEIEYKEGMEFDKGYASPYFVTNPDRMETEISDAYILITDKKISSIQDLLPFLEGFVKVSKNLVIIADEIDGEALATLVVNKLRGTFNAVAIKAPGFGDRRKAMLEDIAILSGGKVISEDMGRKLENVTVEDCGRAEKLWADKENTRIIGGKGDKAAITARIAQIRREIDESTSDFDKEKLQERLAKLAGGVAVINVGAATEIELKDKYENLGAEFLKQAAEKTNDNVGDGTTTSVVLAHAMIEEGEKAISEKGFNVIHLSEELKKASAAVIKGLEAQKEAIDSPKRVHEVATLSAKDADIGKLIADVMGKIGAEGVVTVEDSNTIGNSYEMVEGMQFDRGYISPYMMTNPDKMESVLENPYILVTDQKISAISDLLPLLEKLIQAGKKELVIIAEEVEGEALATLVVNKLRGVFSALAVKAPGFGDRRKEMLEDIASITGADFISEDLGKKLVSVEVKSLGKARKVVADKDNTVIVGGGGDKANIEKRIAQIKSQLQKSDSDFDKEKLQERLGKLSGGVAVIKVGAPTESAQKELKQRVEDAVAATRAAMEEGIVPGGGMALFNVVLGSQDSPSTEVATILQRTLEAPLRAIIVNSGESPDKIVEELKKERSKPGTEWVGFNATTNKLGNLKEAGIIDPLKVTKTAFINAVSVASNYLTIGAAITDIPEEKKNNGPAGGMPGMGGMGDY
ncbi:MAG: chaperonin GroEL, partial [Candidatus Colwellbacteria bacterium]|nr:chaperonin GroEL [Candidatus Colwellbacteria bacterium]